MRVLQIGGILVLALAGMSALSRYGKCREPICDCPSAGCCRGAPSVRTPTAIAPAPEVERPAEPIQNLADANQAASTVDIAACNFTRATNDKRLPFEIRTRGNPVPDKSPRLIYKKPYIVRLMEAFSVSAPTSATE